MNVAYQMSSVFNPATTFIHADGTSALNSAQFYWFVQQRHPADWVVNDFSVDGTSIKGQTNYVNTSSGNLSIDGLTTYQAPYLDVTLLPAWHWLNRVICTDYPRNDSALYNPFSALTNLYGPYKSQGYQLWYVPTHVPTNQLQMGTAALQTMSQANFWNRVIPEFRYCGINSLFDMSDGGFLSGSGGGDFFGGSADPLQVFWCEQQLAGLFDNVQPLPYQVYTNTYNTNIYTTIPISWPTYSVTLGASPASWTNNTYSPVQFYYGSGTAIAAVSVNGVSIPANLTGGMVPLGVNEYITITATTEPTCKFRWVPVQ